MKKTVKNLKKALSLILTAAMIIGMFPMTASAREDVALKDAVITGEQLIDEDIINEEEAGEAVLSDSGETDRIIDDISTEDEDGISVSSGSREATGAGEDSGRVLPEGASGMVAYVSSKTGNWKYTSIDEAVAKWNAAGAGATLQLCSQIETTKTIEVKGGSIDDPMIMDLYSFGILFTGSSGSVINVDEGACLKLIDSQEGTGAGFYVSLSNGRATDITRGFRDNTTRIDSGYIAGGYMLSGNAKPFGHGGGVYNEGTFIFESGNIVGNVAKFGGGVCNSGGTVIMNGGMILNNFGTEASSEVLNDKGAVTVKGGIIDTINTPRGGYVIQNLGSESRFIMKGGSLKDSREKGASLYMMSEGTFIMEGGVISSPNGIMNNIGTMEFKGTIYAGDNPDGSGAVEVDINTALNNYRSYKYIRVVPAPLAGVTPLNGTETLYSDFDEAVTAWNAAGAGATLKLLDNIETTSTVEVTGGSKDEPLVLDLHDHGILFKGEDGCVIKVSGGSLKMEDSLSKSNYYLEMAGKGRASAVLTKQGSDDSVGITGGFIAGGYTSADYSGSGIDICNNGIFIMESGSILGNKISESCGESCGGVYNESGTFIMNGGRIFSNHSKLVAAVTNYGTFIMNGGELNEGSGSQTVLLVYGPNANFTMNGGKIAGYKSYNAVILMSTTFTMTGGEISNNNFGVVSNFASTVNLVGTVYAGKNSDGSGASKVPAETVIKNIVSYRYIKVTPGHHFTYSVKGATITAKCSDSDCDLPNKTASITINALGNLTYDGNAREATISGDTSVLEIPEISYQKKNGTGWDAGTASAPKDAGTYKASITLGEGSGAVTASVSFTIKKAALTATANDKSITYGDEPAGGGITYAGFVNGETSAVLSGKPAYTFSYTRYGNVGSYTITPAGVTSGNYEITFKPGKLNVGQKTVSLKWSTQQLTFNGSAQAPTATADGLVNNDEIKVTVEGAKTDAGSNYTATASALTGTKKGNYKLPDANTKTFSIGKAQAVTIEDVTMDASDRAKEITASVSGFMPKDAGTLAYTKGKAGVTGSVKVDSFEVSKEGKVSVSFSNGAGGDTITLPVTIASTNYKDSSVKVVITLHSKTAAEVSISGGSTPLEKTYGDEDFVLRATADAKAGRGTIRWTADESIVGLSEGKDGSVTVSIKKKGSTRIKAEFESETHAGSAELTLNISEKEVTVTNALAADKVYDAKTNAKISDMGSVNGALPGDDVKVASGKASYEDKNVGTKKVTFSGFTLGGKDAGNYKLASQPEAVTARITPKTVKISVTAKNRSYRSGDTKVELNAGTPTGIISGDDVSVSMKGMYGRMEDADAGTDKSVRVEGIELSGKDAGNYVPESSVYLKVTISKADRAGGNETAVSKTYPSEQKVSDSLELAGFLPDDSGKIAGYGSPAVSEGLHFAEAPAVNNGVLTYTLADYGATQGTISVIAKTNNYKDITIKINTKRIALSLCEKIKNSYEVCSSKKLNAGKSFTLVPVCEGNVFNGVVWSSSNPDIASVTQSGKVTAVRSGVTFISAMSETEPDVVAFCTVNVADPVTEVSLSSKKLSLGTGEKAALGVQVLPFTAGHEIRWSTNKASVAVVCDKNGNELNGTANGTGKVYDITDIEEVSIRGVGGGSAVITAEAADGSGKKKTCSVAVGTPVPDFTISGKKGEDSLKAGKTLAILIDWGKDKPKNTEVKWTLEAYGASKGRDVTYIASISDKGVLTGITSGVVKVKAESAANPSKKAEVIITVTAPDTGKNAEVTGIKLSNAAELEAKGLNAGKSFKLKTELTLYGKGKAAADAIAWISSDESVATVTQKGEVKAVGPGSVSITAIKRNATGSSVPKASVTFKVSAVVKSVRADKSKLTIGTQDDKSRYGRISIAQVLPVNASDVSVEWKSDNGNVKLAAVKNGMSPVGVSYTDATGKGLSGTKNATGEGVSVGAGQYLAIEAVSPGVTKLTGITKDGSNRKLTCTITVRGQVTGLTLKTQSAKNGINDVTQGTVSGNNVTYKSTMKKGGSLKLTPVFEINGVANTQSTKKTYNAYRKYTDLSVSYRSSDTSVATVDKNGKIKIQKNAASGKTATIYGVTADGQRSVEVLVTVK